MNFSYPQIPQIISQITFSHESSTGIWEAFVVSPKLQLKISKQFGILQIPDKKWPSSVR